jgi:CHAT domain-containing protein
VAPPTPDLHFTPHESKAVLDLFEPAARKALETEATPDAVMRDAPGRSYLHFCCHGFYAWQDPMRSALLLAGGKALTLADIIVGLDLSAARLAILSACETGLTDIRQSPDEYLGLPAGFLQAGAPAVASSLWAVDDLSTALLMGEFYRRLLMKNQAPAVALRGAQLWLRDRTAEELHLAETYERFYLGSGRKDKHAWEAMRYYLKNPKTTVFAHPYYWAAFTFSGV